MVETFKGARTASDTGTVLVFPRPLESPLKTIIALALTLLALPASADARSIDKGDAALTARLDLAEYADHRCSLRASCDFASYPDLTKYDCTRARGGTVVCEGSVKLYPTDPGAPEYLVDYCTATVRVRPRGAYRLRARITDWSCV